MSETDKLPNSQIDTTVRPTKKQRDILTYIEQFIGEHGYSPSYREIMNGLQYTSVATVALHVNSLIGRGHLRKRDRSARSLEVVQPTAAGSFTPPVVHDQQWLLVKAERFIMLAEAEAEAEAEADKQTHSLAKGGAEQLAGSNDDAASRALADARCVVRAMELLGITMSDRATSAATLGASLPQRIAALDGLAVAAVPAKAVH